MFHHSVVSAVDELQLVYQCLNMGASDFLTKPIRQETIENLWRTIWRKRRDTELRKRYDEIEGSFFECSEFCFVALFIIVYL